MTEDQILIKHRLKALLKHLKIDRFQLASILKTKKSYVDQILSGKSAVSEPVILKLSKYYTTVNTNWLLTGEGKMLLDDEPKLDQVSEAGVEYRRGRDGDPGAALDSRLQDHEERIRRLEDALAKLEKGKG